MAAIDFPASPTDGQIFVGPNGVTYQYKSSPGMWIVVSTAGGAASILGDFCAGVNSSAPSVPTGSPTVYLFNTIISGNSGGWYNATNGRYTPPAGRYHIYAAINGQNATGGNIIMQLRKNGTEVELTLSNFAANTSTQAEVSATVDANGTDYFDITAYGASVVPVAANRAWFGAFLIAPANPVSIYTTMSLPGDFHARLSASVPGWNGTSIISSYMDVVTGNSGGWFVKGAAGTGGKYTPPPGRYLILGNLSMSSTVGAMSGNLQLNKNGAYLDASYMYTSDPNANANFNVSAVVDANGTDNFDLMFSAAGASNTVHICSFCAIPVQPPALSGGVSTLLWRKLGTVTPGVAVPSIDFQNIPSDINDLMCSFDLWPVINDVGLCLQFYDSLGAISGTYSSMTTASIHNQNATAPVVMGSSAVGSPGYIIMTYSAGTRQVNNHATQGGIKGKFTIPAIRETTHIKTMEFQNTHLSGDANVWVGNVGSGIRSTVGPLTGLKIFFGSSSNIAAGSRVTLWGSP